MLIAGGIVETLSQQNTVDVRTEEVHPLGLEDFKQPLGRHASHHLQVVIAELIHKGLARCLGLLLAAVRTAKRADAAATLNNGILNQTFRQGRGNEVLDAGCTCALSKDCDIVRIATKLCDILMYPFQGRHLVVCTIVARCPVWVFCRQFRVGEEAEDAQAVVDGDENHTPFSPGITVHRNLMAITVEIGPAMYPESHRQFARRISDGICWCPNVQIQTVLALHGVLLPIEFITVERSDGIAWLPADVAEGVSHPDTFPLHDGLRTFPPEVTNRRCCIRDTSENGHVTCCRGNTLYHSSLNFYCGALSPGKSRHQASCQ